MQTYTVEKTIAELSATGSTRKRLALVSWNGRPAKLDLRTWYESDDGEKPGRGITIADAEAADLVAALADHLKRL